MRINASDDSPFYAVHPFPWCPACGSIEHPRVLEEASRATHVVCRECQSQFVVADSHAAQVVAKKYPAKG